MLQPLPTETCKALTMKMEVKYLFPTSSSGVNFCIYQLPEGLEMRKILALGIRMQKNPQTRADIVCIFMDFHRVMQVQSQLAPLHGNFSNGVTNPDIIY